MLRRAQQGLLLLILLAVLPTREDELSDESMSVEEAAERVCWRDADAFGRCVEREDGCEDCDTPGERMGSPECNEKLFLFHACIEHVKTMLPRLLRHENVSMPRGVEDGEGGCEAQDCTNVHGFLKRHGLEKPVQSTQERASSLEQERGTGSEEESACRDGEAQVLSEHARRKYTGPRFFTGSSQPPPRAAPTTEGQRAKSRTLLAAVGVPQEVVGEVDTAYVMAVRQIPMRSAHRLLRLVRSANAFAAKESEEEEAATQRPGDQGAGAPASARPRRSILVVALSHVDIEVAWRRFAEAARGEVVVVGRGEAREIGALFPLFASAVGLGASESLDGGKVRCWLNVATLVAACLRALWIWEVGEEMVVKASQDAAFSHEPCPSVSEYGEGGDRQQASCQALHVYVSTRTHAHPPTHPPTRTHARTHACTHTHTHTRTHISIWRHSAPSVLLPT